MKDIFLVAALVVLNAGGAAASELPVFEIKGLPISRHQVAVLGSTNVQERAVEPGLTLGGMPASPHQIAVLSPRPRMVTEASAAKAADTAVSRH